MESGFWERSSPTCLFGSMCLIEEKTRFPSCSLISYSTPVSPKSVFSSISFWSCLIEFCRVYWLDRFSIWNSVFTTSSSWYPCLHVTSSLVVAFISSMSILSRSSFETYIFYFHSTMLSSSY